MAIEEAVMGFESIAAFTLSIVGIMCTFYYLSVLVEKHTVGLTNFVKIVNFIVICLSFVTYDKYPFIISLIITVSNVCIAIVLWSGYPKTKVNTPKHVTALIMVIVTHFSAMINAIFDPPELIEGIFVFLVLIWLSPLLTVSIIMKISRKGRGQYVGFWKEAFESMASGMSRELNHQRNYNRRP